MSTLSWQHIRRRRLSRRQILNASARMGVGAAGLALVGCGGDDDEEEEAAEQVTPAAEEQVEEQAVAEQAEEQAMEEEAVAQTQVEEVVDPVAEILNVKMSDAIKQKIFRTLDIELDPIAESAYARADTSIFPVDEDLLLDGWRSGTLETGRGNVRIGFAEGFGSDTYRLSMVMELMLQAATYPEVASVQYVTALGDTTKALSDVQAFTAQGVDIIIGHFDIGETALQVVKDATAEGIIVVNEYFEIGGEPGVDFVGLANAELCDVGEELARALLAEYEARGLADPNYFLLGGTPANTFTEAWEVCADAVMEASGATKLGRADTDWTLQGTFEAAAAALASESRIRRLAVRLRLRLPGRSTRLRGDRPGVGLHRGDDHRRGGADPDLLGDRGREPRLQGVLRQQPGEHPAPGAAHGHAEAEGDGERAVAGAGAVQDLPRPAAGRDQPAPAGRRLVDELDPGRLAGRDVRTG